MLVAALLGALLIAMIWYADAMWRRRRNLFAKRQPLTEAEWFARHAPTTSEQATEAARIFRWLGAELGIEWTRLRPGDDLSVFRLPGGAGDGDELGDFDSRLRQWCDNHSVAVPDLGNVETVGDLVTRIIDLTSRSPGRKGA